MKSLLIVILGCITSPVFGQKIPVPQPLAAPDSGLHQQIPVISRAAAPLVKEEDPSETFYYRALHLALAGDLVGANQQLDSLSGMDGHGGPPWLPVVGIAIRSYVRGLQGSAKAKQSFQSVLIDTVGALYMASPSRSRQFITSFFPADSSGTLRKLQTLLGNLRGKDSITVSQANELADAWFAWYCSRQMTPAALRAFRKQDEKVYVIQDSTLIDVGGGVKLSAVIVRKRSVKGKQPVIMRYNIYASQADLASAQMMADKGYVGIILLTRGKYLSQNETEPFEHDAADVYKAIDWISKQSWCNGKVGMYGGSYLGFSQWSAVKKVHPALKTIVPQVAVGAGIDYPQTNGVFMSYMLQWIHYVTNNRMSDRMEFNNQAHWDSVFHAWYRSGRSFRSLDTIDGRPNRIFQRWLDHPEYDAYWQQMVPYKDEFAKLNIPVLTTTGYYDDDQRGAFYYMQEHLRRNPAANHTLLIGPWNHGGAQGLGNPRNGQLLIDSVAQMDVNTTVFQWFDHILKDSTRPALLKDRVNFEVLGANEWRSAPSLAAASNDSLQFYLGHVFSGKGYQLLNRVPAEAGEIVQEVNLADRSDLGEAVDPDGPVLDTVLRSDHQLLFYSDTLTSALIMNGSLTGSLQVTINKKDFNVLVRLYELTREGKYYQLSRFWAQASYMNNREQRSLLVPGTLSKIPVNNAYYMCKKLAAGSRLVLSVGVLKGPNWEINYGSGKPVADETMADAAEPLRIRWNNSSSVSVPLLR